MENSSIQPSSVLTDYPSVRADVQQLADDDFDALCDGVVEYLFKMLPATHTVAPHFAQFFRDAAERSAAVAKGIAASKMAAYTSPDGAHYTEDREAFLTKLSTELHTNEDYRAAFDAISKATRSGELPPSTVPEIATPEN